MLGTSKALNTIISLLSVTTLMDVTMNYQQGTKVIILLWVDPQRLHVKYLIRYFIYRPALKGVGQR